MTLRVMNSGGLQDDGIRLGDDSKSDRAVASPIKRAPIGTILDGLALVVLRDNRTFGEKKI